MALSDLAYIVLLAISALFAFRTMRYAVRLLRGYNRRRMLEPLLGSLGDGAGGAGLSLIGVDIDSAETVADMLATEYRHFEAVVVVDSARTPQLLGTLVETYSLVSVDYRRPDSFAPAVGVRGLYRSRQRRFRRLTLIDTAALSPQNDADAAADIAIYDYVAVIHGNTTLLPLAVERIAAEIASAEVPPHEICTRAGAELTVCMRDDVFRHGGFASGRHFCPPSQRVPLYETIAVTAGWSRGVRIVTAAFVALLAAAALFSWWVGSPVPAAVVAATAILALASVLFSMPFVAPHLTGRRAFAYTLRNFCEKLLLKSSQ